MGESSLQVPPPEQISEKRLDSWKEIAAYLNRDVTTAQRWEKREGMPVHRHLHDTRGSVYALSAELDAWLASRRLGSEAEPAAETDPPKTSGIETGQLADRRRRPLLVVSGIVIVGLVAVGCILFFGRRLHSNQPAIRSIAVLPLKNLSADPAQQYLADGMTEALIGRLSGIHDLRVISRTSVMRFKDTELPVSKIAETLGVDGIVEGSVIRDGSHVRVTAQLIRAASDEHIWSETYDREMIDVLTLESAVANSIADKVAVTVTGTERERLSAGRQVAPEVYESYLKGRFAEEKSTGRAGLEEAIGYFEDAVKRDPAFAPSYVGLARDYTRLGTVFVGESPTETRSKVLSAARKAIELDPSLAEAHALLAQTYQQEWRWADAETEYKQALELGPNDAEANAGYALWLICQARTDEALTWARRARELDPVAVTGTRFGWMLFLSHHYAEAERELHTDVAVRPDDPMTLWYLGFVAIAENKPDDAIPILEKAAAASNRSSGVLGVLAAAYGKSGRRNDALRVIAELKQRKETGYVPAAALANAYSGLGDRDETLHWLEQAYKEQSNILQYMKVHPFYDFLRGDPRFVDLIQRVGLG